MESAAIAVVFESVIVAGFESCAHDGRHGAMMLQIEGWDRVAAMARRASRLIAAAACALVSTGCAQGANESESRPGGIITYAPNITETVFALGQGHRIVGVTVFCDYPPEAASKEVIGGYLDPNLERITALAPELIILPGKLEKIAELARQNGIPVLHAHMDNLQTIHDGIMSIGEALDCKDRAQALWAGMQRDLQRVREAVKDRSRPRVLLVHTRRDHDLNNIFTVGRTSFLSELADIAGTENIFADVEQAYFEASKESVVLRAPDIIIEFHAGEDLSEDEKRRFAADWQRLPSVPAVRDGRIHLFLESYGLRPGPRVAKIAAELAKMAHPGVQLELP